ncbi:ankyrin-1-like [Branchiostoma lanceolatum]|uniref:ankyrin-1-like n=1 Tax=Branchiostoma lanceolatum TaxID=7740 RepID=UPI0034533C14
MSNVLEKLKHAISTNDLQKIQQILCTTNVNLNSKARGYNPLLQACVKGSPVVAGALVKAGADVNVRVQIQTYYAREQNGLTTREILQQALHALWGTETVTPLILGVVDRNLAIVKKLVQDCGADVNVTNEAGKAPLHLKQEIADLLLKAGADVNVQDKKGQTPLHCAATAKDLDYTRRLLEYGARVDLANNEGFTALHIAAKQADTQLLELLIQQEGIQALVNQKAHDDATPLHIAITAKAKAQYQVADDVNWIAVVRLLIDNGADLTSQKHGLTPLHLAAEAGYLDIVQMLVEAGANIRAEASFTCLTPIDMAVHTQKQEIVDYLVARAEIDAVHGGRPKRDLPSVEEAEDNAASQQEETLVEDISEEGGAVGGFEKLVIKDEDGNEKK